MNTVFKWQLLGLCTYAKPCHSQFIFCSSKRYAHRLLLFKQKNYKSYAENSKFFVLYILFAFYALYKEEWIYIAIRLNWIDAQTTYYVLIGFEYNFSKSNLISLVLIKNGGKIVLFFINENPGCINNIFNFSNISDNRSILSEKHFFRMPKKREKSKESANSKHYAIIRRFQQCWMKLFE